MQRSTLCLFLIFRLCSSDGDISSFKLDRTSAEQSCKMYFGLLPYTVFSNDVSETYFSKNVRNIPDGESFWVSGYVKYSKPVSWQGCYREDKNWTIVSYSTSITTIYSCLDTCNSYENTLYIGIRKNTCSCIKSSDWKDKYPEADQLCGILDDNEKILDTKYGPKRVEKRNGDVEETFIKIYKVYHESAMPMKLDVVNTSSQCFFATFINDSNDINSDIKYSTKSCYDSDNGYVCVDGGVLPLNGSCEKFWINPDPYCVMKPPANWLQANLKCRQLHGKIIEVYAPKVQNTLQRDIPYWTGLFRDFKILSLPDEPDGNNCLSVRKVGFEFRFEPDMCSNFKYFVCSMPSLNNLTNQTCESESETKMSGREKSFIISLTINGLFLALFVFTAITIYRLVKQTTKKFGNKRINNSNIEMEHVYQDLQVASTSISTTNLIGRSPNNVPLY